MDESVVREIQGLVNSTFTPNIVVASTPEVNDAFQKANLKPFIEILRTFSTLRRKIGLRNVNDQPYEIPDFQVRFMDLIDLRIGGNHAKTTQNLASIVSSCCPQGEKRYGTPAFRDRSGIAHFLRDAVGNIPWFQQYRTAYLQSLGMSEHEFFDHPVACVTVATLANIDDSVAIYDQLFNPQSPPPLLQEEYVDQNIFIMRVIIDDGKEDRKLVEQKLTKMRKQYGNGYFLLKLNSLSNEKIGDSIRNISIEDSNRVEEFVNELVTKGIIPHIEKTMRTLNEQVAATRRGFRNQVKLWLRPFGGGSTEAKKVKSESSDESTKIYAINSTGAICRQLADFSFMLRDYDSAQQNYKTCSKDFQNDKALKYASGSYEMIGLCSFFLEPSRKDAESELTKAYEAYLRVGTSATRYALRAVFLLGCIYRARKNYLEAASVYIRGADATDDPLMAALLQEQAAFCYLINSPTMYRRFAYRLVAAGDLFYRSYQLQHSLGCLLFSYGLYEGKDWVLVQDNLRFAIGRVSFLLGNIDRANEFFQMLLVSQDRTRLLQQPNQQNSYLREFLYIFKKYGNDRDLLAESPIPLINNESVRVALNGSYDTEGDLQVWTNMEDKIINEEIYDRYGFQIGKKKPAGYVFIEEQRISVVSEPIYIETEIKNPLNVPLQLSSLQLVCWHGEKPLEPSESEYEEDTVEVEQVNVLLGAGETKKIRLMLTPLKEGYLKITGLGFYLARGVWARRDFRLQGKRLNDTLEQKQGKVYAPNTINEVFICGKMPLLEINHTPFPETIFQGEICKIIVNFKNSGSLGLKNVKVHISHPSFATFGTVNDLKSAEGTLENKFNAFINFGEKPTLRKNASIIHLPIELQPGESTSLPLWIRGDSKGPLTLNILFYYEPNEPELNPTKMKYRLSRLSKDIRVIPSIQINTFTNPSSTGLDSYLLGLEVENLQNSSSIVLKQLTSISNCWQIIPLSYDEAHLALQTDMSMFIVRAMQTTNLFFRIVPIPSSNQAENSDTKRTHASLSFGQKYIDSTVPPYLNFLEREKVYMKILESQTPEAIYTANPFARIPIQTEVKPPLPPNALDFILFWETLDGKHFGQHNITGIALQPHDILSPELIVPESPIRFLIQSETKRTHDFDTNMFCVVPVKFLVKNTSLTTPVSFTLESIKPSDLKEANEAIGQTRSQYFWSGGTSTTVTNLEPQAETQLSVNVCFTKPGVYNLNRFRFALLSGLSSPVPVVSPFGASVSTPHISAPHSHNNSTATLMLPSSPAAPPQSSSSQSSNTGGSPKYIYGPFQHLITIEKPSSNSEGA